MKKIFEMFDNLIFPQGIKCIFCGDELNEKRGNCTCDKCREKLPFTFDEKICVRCGDKISSMSNYCLVCKNKKRNFDIARSTFFYQSLVVKCIVDFKFNSAKFLAKPLSYFLAETYRRYNFCADMLVCVPMTNNKLKKRGYNQADLLAKNLSCLIDVPYIENALIKVKDTQSQVDLKFNERNKNIEKAYKVKNKQIFSNMKVLLVDDVLTTGATCDECARVLKNAGAEKIFVLTLARTHIKK